MLRRLLCPFRRLGEEFMKAWTVHRRIVVGLCAAILAIAALGVSGIMRLVGIESRARLIVTDSMPGLNYTTQIELYTHQKSVLIQRHILANDPAEKRRLEEEIRVVSARAAKALEQYGKTPFSDVERPLYENVMAVRPGYLAAVDKVLRLSREAASAELQVELQRVFEPQARAYILALHKSTEHNLEEADDAAQSIQASVVSAKRSSMVEALSSLVLAVISAFLLARGIAETETASRAIAGLNRELEARVDELTSVNRELEAFTYSVSHDLRAPLRHIDGFSKMLGDHSAGQLNPNGERALERIRYGAQQMGRMIDDLLAFSRMGRRELAKRLTSLRTIVDDSMEILTPAMQDREIGLQIGELPTVDCDPALVKHVIVNLLSNAIKFTRESKPALIEVGQLSSEGEPTVFVRDNGVGFDIRYSDKLFGIFQRLHRREDYDGVGVGLATVQRIVHKHGGRVWADSQIGKGATFYFTLGPDKNNRNSGERHS
jgi:signal transduction histidine kinase